MVNKKTKVSTNKLTITKKGPENAFLQMNIRCYVLVGCQTFTKRSHLRALITFIFWWPFWRFFWSESRLENS